MSRSTTRHVGRTAGPRNLTPFLLGVCVGMTVTLLIGLAAFLTTRPGSSATEAPAPAAEGRATPTGGPPAAAVGVSVRHLGDLSVLIEAQVSAPTSYDPITKARVVAYTDMTAMPMAHRQGPIVLAEIGGRKGVYQGTAKLAMIGEYDIRVEVVQPMPAVAHERFTVQNLSPTPP